jgi:hypothetical protein
LPHQFIDHTGERWGQIVITQYAGKSKGNKSLWKAQCDCGNQTIVYGQSLRSGKTTSCGHFREDAPKLRSTAATNDDELLQYEIDRVTAIIEEKKRSLQESIDRLGHLNKVQLVNKLKAEYEEAVEAA